MKKAIKVMGAVFLSLSLCWFIGQQLKLVREVKQMPEEVQSMENEADDLQQLQLTFEGAQDTEGNPWGKTAGNFEMEELGNCILLTPNTAVTMEVAGDETEVLFQTRIHPWMLEHTDGAGLLIWVMNADDTILHQEEWKISTTDAWETRVVALEKYENASKIKIFCNNGSNEDDSGDWIVIKMAE